MSTTADVQLTCASCGTESEHTVTLSSATRGMDLDGRLGGAARNDRFEWPVRCPSCDYCFYNIEFEPPGGLGVLETPAYRAIVENAEYPPDVQLWLACGEVLVSMGALDMAGACALSAAWVCDDAGLGELAATCRTTARERILAAIAADGIAEERLAAAYATLADIDRRLGDLVGAAAFLAHAGEHHPEGDWLTALADQRRAIMERDTQARSVDTPSVILIPEE